MEVLEQLLITGGTVLAGVVTVWRMVVNMRVKREAAEIELREYFRGEIARRDATVDELRDAHFISQERIGVLVRSNDEAQRYREQAEKRAEQWHHSFLALEQQTADLTMKLNQSQALAAEIPALRAEIDTLKRQVDELRDALATKNRQNASLQEENERLQRENQAYESRIIKMNVRLNELQGEVSRLATRVGQLEREKEELEQQVKEIEIVDHGEEGRAS